MARNYKLEYENFHSRPEEKKLRAERNKARKLMEKKGLVHKGDGKDVDHKNGNPTDNSRKNLAVKSKTANRSFSRKANPKKYGKNLGASNPPTQKKYL